MRFLKSTVKTIAACRDAAFLFKQEDDYEAFRDLLASNSFDRLSDLARNGRPEYKSVLAGAVRDEEARRQRRNRLARETTRIRSSLGLRRTRDGWEI